MKYDNIRSNDYFYLAKTDAAVAAVVDSMCLEIYPEAEFRMSILQHQITYGCGLGLHHEPVRSSDKYVWLKLQPYHLAHIVRVCRKSQTYKLYHGKADKRAFKRLEASARNLLVEMVEEMFFATNDNYASLWEPATEQPPKDRKIYL